jgi:hypothetical protein
MAVPRLALAAAAAIAACSWFAWWTWSWIDAGRPNGHLPANFPNAYLAPADNGHRDLLKVWRGRVPPAPPIAIDGVDCWPAYTCWSSQCPYLAKEGHPWIFAYGNSSTAPADGGPAGWCVHCSKAGKDPTDVHFATTDEGERILERIRGPITH